VRDEAYFTTLLWQKNGQQYGLSSQTLFDELYKIMVNKVTFLGFMGAIAPISPLDPPLNATPQNDYTTSKVLRGYDSSL